MRKGWLAFGLGLCLLAGARMGHAQEAEAAPAAPKGPLRVSGSVFASSKISGSDPVYPADAMAAQVQGAVVLHVVVSKEGTVESLEPISGPETLRAAAREAVKGWRYRPYLLSGEPVEVETMVTVNFQPGTAMAPLPPQAETLPAGVRQVGGGVLPPVVIHMVEPKFSKEAAKAHVGGTVLVGLWVDTEGKPQNVHVIRGVGMGLDEEAVKAVKEYLFKPALESEKPVVVELTIQVNFLP